MRELAKAPPAVGTIATTTMPVASRLHMRVETGPRLEGGSPMPAFCSNCGGALADGARFCASCGTPTNGSGQVDPAAQAPVPEIVEPRLRTSIPDFVREQLHPSEQVLAAFPASLADHRRTGEFRHDKFVHKGMGQMPYRGITESHFNKGFRHGTVVVEGANAGLTISGISNDDAAFAERVISAFVGGRPLALSPST
jgi:zinc-ribbon domain